MLHIAPQVLVLDDDAAICGVVEEALADDGWDVQTRTRGWAALEFLQRRAVDVILLDLRVPPQSGRHRVGGWRSGEGLSG
jgi:DNA-binding response OmpR family regulator